MAKGKQQLSRTNARAQYARVAAHSANRLARWGLRRLMSNAGIRRKPAVIRRKLNKNIIPVGTGASQSFFKKSYKPRLATKILKELQPIRALVETSAERITTTQYGVQRVTSVAQFPCGAISNFFTNLVDTNGSNTQQCILRSIEQEYMISNASSTNVFIKIYECTARNDFFSTTNSTSLGLSIWHPTGAFDQGVYDVNNGMNANTLGITPFNSQLFTNNWIVDKIYHVELGAGRSHKHLSRFSPNRMVLESRVSRNSILKGVTRAVMILAYGSPINDTTNNTLVSTSHVELNIVRKQVSKIQFLNPQGQVFFNVQGLQAVTVAEHIDEEGNIQNEVET